MGTVGISSYPDSAGSDRTFDPHEDQHHRGVFVSAAIVSHLDSPPQPIALRVGPAAALSGLPKTRLYELMAAGELPFVRDGARRLILVSDLLAYLEARRVDARSS
jgi:excisionase family DNA binding protein